jgi:TnpA family transposase
VPHGQRDEAYQKPSFARGVPVPHRSILSAAERESLLALPDVKDELIRHYTFNETDLSIIRQHRGNANRLGFAIQLSYLRFPGVVLGVGEPPFLPLLRMVARCRWKAGTSTASVCRRDGST